MLCRHGGSRPLSSMVFNFAGWCTVRPGRFWFKERRWSRWTRRLEIQIRSDGSDGRYDLFVVGIICPASHFPEVVSSEPSRRVYLSVVGGALLGIGNDVLLLHLPKLGG